MHLWPKRAGRLHGVAFALLAAGPGSLLLATPPLLASETASEQAKAPEIGPWIAAAATNRNAGIPYLLTIVGGPAQKAKNKTTPAGDSGSGVKFLPLAPADFDKLSYLHLANVANAAWDYQLNKSRFEKLSAVEIAVALTRADTVLNIPDDDDEEWELWRPLGPGGKLRLIAKAPGPETATGPAIINWIFSRLGWDGVVLSQKGDYLLVGAASDTLAKTNIQALAVSNSVAKVALTPKERQGSGLLSLSASQEGIGIFDIVLLGQGVKALPPGTKLLIEKKP